MNTKNSAPLVSFEESVVFMVKSTSALNWVYLDTSTHNDIAAGATAATATAAMWYWCTSMAPTHLVHQQP